MVYDGTNKALIILLLSCCENLIPLFRLRVKLLHPYYRYTPSTCTDCVRCTRLCYYFTYYYWYYCCLLRRWRYSVTTFYIFFLLSCNKTCGFCRMNEQWKLWTSRCKEVRCPFRVVPWYIHRTRRRRYVFRIIITYYTLYASHSESWLSICNPIRQQGRRASRPKMFVCK